MKHLYEFNMDYGRMGSIHGRFLATQEDIDGIIGKTVYFGEMLGKHSDVYGEMEADNFTLVTDDVGFLTLANELGIDLGSGVNPFDYLEEEEEE